MPRKVTQDEIKRELDSAYDAIVHIFRVTSREERVAVATEWCKDKESIERYYELCETRRILYPIDLIIAALIEVVHPLITKPNGDFLPNNFVHARVLITIAHLHNTPVPIPMSTGVEQTSLVHIARASVPVG